MHFVGREGNKNLVSFINVNYLIIFMNGCIASLAEYGVSITWIHVVESKAPKQWPYLELGNGPKNAVI